MATRVRRCRTHAHPHPHTFQHIPQLHPQHVNALVVDSRMGRVYTGDGDGIIWIWKRDGNGSHCSQFQPHMPLTHSTFKKRAITHLTLHPVRRG